MAFGTKRDTMRRNNRRNGVTLAQSPDVISKYFLTEASGGGSASREEQDGVSLMGSETSSLNGFIVADDECDDTDGDKEDLVSPRELFAEANKLLREAVSPEAEDLEAEAALTLSSMPTEKWEAAGKAEDSDDESVQLKRAFRRGAVRTHGMITPCISPKTVPDDGVDIKNSSASSKESYCVSCGRSGSSSVRSIDETKSGRVVKASKRLRDSSVLTGLVASLERQAQSLEGQLKVLRSLVGDCYEGNDVQNSSSHISWWNAR
jgi:hypothetical protein